MENTEQNREIIAEAVASEYTDDELRELIIDMLMGALKESKVFFDKAIDLNPEKVNMVKIAVDVLNIPPHCAIEEYDASPSNLQRMIRDEKRKSLKTLQEISKGGPTKP